MRQITRRESIRLASATALLTLFNSGAESHGFEGKKSSNEKGELMLIGPFLLGELYRSGKRSMGNEITNGHGPSDAKLAEAFNECQLYIIDKRYRDKSGEWRFADEKYPQIAAQGKLHFKLKDKNDRDFKVYFADLVLANDSTNYDTKPPTRYSYVGCQFEVVMGNFASEPELATYGVAPDKRIIYDINGRILAKKP